MGGWVGGRPAVPLTAPYPELTVPVALGDRLRVKGAVDLEVLAHAGQNVPRDRELVGGRNADARADLVLPLARHDLTVRARDLVVVAAAAAAVVGMVRMVVLLGYRLG